MKAQPHFDYLWVDLELSGLDLKSNRILEFACVLTDKYLKGQQPGPALIIHCDEEHLKGMDNWNMTHHTASGLYKSCLESKITVEQAESAVLEFLAKYQIQPGQLIIAGNSIHTDKSFLAVHMPKLNNFLHYRILDVSSLKLVVNMKCPAVHYQKKGSHRAVDDIRESIGELQHYIKYAFK